MKNYILGFALLSSLAACKNDTYTTTSENTTVQNEQSVHSYKHFRGNIGDLAVVMDLVQSGDSTKARFKGYYSYDKYGQPIAISGGVDSVGNIVLQESSIEENSAFFSGKMVEKNTFSGTWTDAKGAKKLPFSLTETYNDSAIAFIPYPFSDSFRLKPTDTHQATFSMDLILPKNDDAFLKNQIYKYIKCDSIDKTYPYKSPKDLQEEMRKTFFDDYKSEITAAYADPNFKGSETLNYASESNVLIVSNTGRYLSLGFNNYSYSGGAHGLYGTTLKTFDMQQKKLVTLQDIFKDGYPNFLNAALTRACRRHFNLKSTMPLSEVLFEDILVFNNNFAYTPKGLLFNYAPYEIAAYAYGEIELFVPFEEMKDFLK